MNQAFKFLAIAMLVAVLFSACKKDNDDNNNVVVKTTIQKLQNKWTFDKEYDHSYYLGTEYRDTTLGVAGDYIDFRTDNKVYVNIQGFTDTSAYNLINDTQVIIDGDTSQIQVLNDTNLQLYSKSGTANDYDEYTDYLHK